MTKLNDMDNVFLEKIFPWLLVHYEVDELYLKQPQAAVDFIMNKLDEESILDRKNVMLVTRDFNVSKIKFLSFINKVKDEDFLEFKEMFLFQAVSIFESTINSWFNFELKASYGLSHTRTNEVLTKLNMNDKLDWLLKLLTGESFIYEKSWSTIKQMISIRNFYTHFKPVDIYEFNIHSQNLTKESLLEFLDACSNCYNFLHKRKGNELSNHNERLQFITEVFKRRHSK